MMHRNQTVKRKICQQYKKAASSADKRAILKEHGIASGAISAWRKELKAHDAKVRSLRVHGSLPEETKQPAPTQDSEALVRKLAEVLLQHQPSAVMAAVVKHLSKNGSS